MFYFENLIKRCLKNPNLEIEIYIEANATKWSAASPKYLPLTNLLSKAKGHFGSFTSPFNSFITSQGLS